MASDAADWPGFLSASALKEPGPDATESVRLHSLLGPAIAECRFVDAEAYCLRLLQLTPNDLNLICELGRLYYLQGRYPAAEQLVQRAVLEGTDDINSFASATLLAKIQLAEGEFAKCQKTCVVDIREHIGRQNTIALFSRGCVIARLWRRMGRIDDAIQAYRDLVWLVGHVPDPRPLIAAVEPVIEDLAELVRTNESKPSAGGANN